MEEPSVLDYLKAKLMPWRGPAPEIPAAAPGESQTAPEGEAVPAAFALEMPAMEGADSSAPAVRAAIWPWRALSALALALLAQISLSPGPDRSWLPGFALYLLAFGMLAWATLKDEWLAAAYPQQWVRLDPLTVHSKSLLVGAVLALAAFLTLGGNKFTVWNVPIWVAAILVLSWAFWLPQPSSGNFLACLRSFLTKSQWRIKITRWMLLVLLACGVVLFFRVYHINQVPPEMVSDQAEKLLDIWDVLHGQTRIFFPRNTGREGMQMYMTAAIIRLFGTGVTYLSLKIGTILAGLLTLPFIYLLGKELANRRAALLAMFLAGVAYWPNVISRVGLRFPLYPLFVAPTLYFLLRGIRTSNRNDFILSGLALGIGLHGYTPIRILPFVVVTAVGIYLIHSQSVGQRRQTIWRLIVLALISLIVFLPLLRYSIENPELFAFRSFSRVGSVERPLPGPAGPIFLNNLWHAMTMFGWDDGEIWVTSITHRPALDLISAALFYLGFILLLVRYVRRRHWLDLFLLLSVPLLLMPSILSLAFPGENPSLNRMGGAIVPVFLIVGIALDGIMQGLSERVGSRFAWTLALVLLVFSSTQNFTLVFDEYQHIFELSAWNTTEMGSVIHDFAGSIGTPDTAWVVAYPYWVDTRLVGINAGFPTRDYAIAPEHLGDTTADPRTKLFLLNMEDAQDLQTLRSLYPNGVLQQYDSKVDNHDFYLFFVPPTQ